jgi:hypothetical protein
MWSKIECLRTMYSVLLQKLWLVDFVITRGSFHSLASSQMAFRSIDMK